MSVDSVTGWGDPILFATIMSQHCYEGITPVGQPRCPIEDDDAVLSFPLSLLPLLRCLGRTASNLDPVDTGAFSRHCKVELKYYVLHKNNFTSTAESLFKRKGLLGHL